jgi:hypothetical protein
MEALTRASHSNGRPRLDDVYAHDKENIRRMASTHHDDNDAPNAHPESSRSTGMQCRHREDELNSPRARKSMWFPSVHWVLLVMVGLLTSPTAAVYISFSNCLPVSTQNSAVLQFVPKFVDAVFNTTDRLHNMRITVWGNVTGSMYTEFVPPAANDSYWSDPTKTDGKILNVTNNVLTALRSHIDFLNYQPWAQNVEFCAQVINGTCPLGPSFAANPYVPPL